MTTPDKVKATPVDMAEAEAVWQEVLAQGVDLESLPVGSLGDRALIILATDEEDFHGTIADPGRRILEAFYHVFSQSPHLARLATQALITVTKARIAKETNNND